MLQPDTARKGENERHQARLNKRKSAADALGKLREELFSGAFDGWVSTTTIFRGRSLTMDRLLMASQHDPLSVLDKLEPYLAGSSSIVVYSAHIQVPISLDKKVFHLPGLPSGCHRAPKCASGHASVLGPCCDRAVASAISGFLLLFVTITHNI
jgi:hypothetical protein